MRFTYDSYEATLRNSIRERAGFQCEYCLMPEAESFFPFEPDHIIALGWRALSHRRALKESLSSTPIPMVWVYLPSPY